VKIFSAFALILGLAFIYNFNSPLQGTHTIRQSDTVFAAYCYCTEGAEFLKPRIAHGGLTGGVAIGEFPIYSYMLSLPCQIRGTWSEWDVKFFILLLWILNLMVWTLWSRAYFREKNLSSFAILLGFSTFSLLFMTVSLPDNLAFLLVGLAAWLEIRFPKKWTSFVSALLFILAFAVRPYFIPLMLLVHRRWLWMIATGLGCIAVYFIWYKIWAQHSELNYYYIAIPPVTEIILGLPRYAGPLLETILREWFHYIFIVLLFWKWRALEKVEVFGLVASLGLVILVRGEHLIVHSYYMWAAAVYAFLCLVRALMTLKPWQQSSLLILYGVIGMAQTQHQFHAQAETRSRQVQELLVTEHVPAAAKIAVFVGDGSCSTHYLYWFKHHGWCLYEKEFHGPESCPQGADYFFRYDGEQPILKPCVFAPSEKPSDK
jgi:hypothetical protein